MIVSKEPIASIASRVSREMMPCPYPGPLPCVPVPLVAGVQIVMGTALEGRGGEREEQRATLLPFRGMGALRDETKRPRGRLLALL